MATTKPAAPLEKELTFEDRLKLFMRNNEKLLWVILLVLISFSFAFTGPVMDMFSGGGRSNDKLYLVYDETVYKNDLQELHSQFSTVTQLRQIAMSTYFGASLFTEISPRFATIKAYVDNPTQEGTQRSFSVLDSYIYEREADRLGIYVSEEELIEEILFLYRGIQVAIDSEETASFKATQKRDTAAMAIQLAQFKENRTFDAQKWKDFLKKRRTNPKQVEKALRKYMRIEKVMNYILATKSVSEDDVLVKYREEEQSKNFSFVEYKPAEDLRKEVEASITDEALKAHYDESLGKYQLPPARGAKLKFDYLLIPFDHFKENAKPTEENIKEHYMKVRDKKFKKSLDIEDEGFEVLTPEEKKAREEKLYSPLEEVRDQVIADLKVELGEKDAEAYAISLKTDLYKAPTGGAGSKVSGKTFADIAKVNSFVKTGTTPFMYSYEVRDKAPDANSAQVTTWFGHIRANKNVTDPTKVKKIAATSAYYRAHGSKGFIFYKNPTLLNPGEESFEDLKEEVRKGYITAKFLDKAEETLKARLEKAKTDRTSLEDLAKEWGSKVQTSDFQKRFGSIMLPEEPAEGETEPPKDKDGNVKKKYFPAGRSVLSAGFEIEKEGELADPVRFERDEVFYVVRYDASQAPDDLDMTDASRRRWLGQLEADARDIYFTQRYGELRSEANFQSFIASEPEENPEGEGEGKAPQG